jgi:PEP-CTERM motif
MKNLLQAGLLALCLSVSVPAVPLVESWDFTGTCSDCPDFGFGTLTASTSNNVVTFSFSYNSDWISYTLTNPQVRVNSVIFNGSSFTLAPTDRVDLYGTAPYTSFGGVGNPVPVGTTTENLYFRRFSNGNWETGVNVPGDFGTNGAFVLQGNNSPVPEPSTMGLAGLSAGLLAFRVWRQRKA